MTALVRDLSKAEKKTNLSLLKGTPTSQRDVRAAFQSQRFDAVIVALNAPRETDSPFAKSISPPRLMADSVQNATIAMKENHVPKIIVMQASGVGSSFQNLNFLMRWVIGMSEMCMYPFSY